MTLPAAVIAIIRTGVQAFVSWVLSAAGVVAALDWLANNANIQWTEEAIANTAFGITLSVVVGLVNHLGKRWPWVNQVFSLFTSDSSAIYEKTAMAGGDDVPDVEVDTGGEDMGLERGAVSVGLLLALTALALAIAFFLFAHVELIAVAVICLAVAHLVGNSNIG